LLPLPKLESDYHFILGVPPPSLSMDIIQSQPQVHLLVCNSYPLGAVEVQEVPCTKRV